MLLMVWFKSEAFVEYAKLLRVQNFFFIPLYERDREKDPSLSYLDYLAINHDNFFVKLITCPLCLAFWISILICLHFDNLIFLPVVYIFGLTSYGLTSKSLE